MAVSGLPDLCEDHAKNIARLALDMLEMAKNVKMGDHQMVKKNLMFRVYKFSSSTFSERNNWNTFWRGSYRSHWKKDAEILSIRKHGKFNKPNRNYWFARTHQCKQRSIQVKKNFNLKFPQSFDNFHIFQLLV